MQKKWYAVYTHPKWEKKVVASLAAQNIEQYCPLQRSVRQWADRKKVVYEPFFTSYVFVHIGLLEQVPVRQTPGVLNFVNVLNRPAVIQDKEMENLQSFLKKYEYVPIEKVPLKVNDTVEVLQGALECREGKIVEVMHQYVKVVLPSLGCALVARLSIRDVVKLQVTENSENLN